MSAFGVAENGTLVTRILRPDGERLGLGQPDVGDLGLGEDGRRRLVVVEVAVLDGVQAHHVLGHLAALHGGDRRQRQLAAHVAGGVDVRHVALAVVVDGDVAARGRARRRPPRARGPSVFGTEPMASTAWLSSRPRDRRRSATDDLVLGALDGVGPGALQQA